MWCWYLISLHMSTYTQTDTQAVQSETNCRDMLDCKTIQCPSVSDFPIQTVPQWWSLPVTVHLHVSMLDSISVKMNPFAKPLSFLNTMSKLCYWRARFWANILAARRKGGYGLLCDFEVTKSESYRTCGEDHFIRLFLLLLLPSSIAHRCHHHERPSSLQEWPRDFTMESLWIRNFPMTSDPRTLPRFTDDRSVYDSLCSHEAAHCLFFKIVGNVKLLLVFGSAHGSVLHATLLAQHVYILKEWTKF